MRELDNAYRILELEPGASMEEVNQAYKDLVFVWHPDRIPQDNDRLYQKAQDKIKALNQARDLLRSQSRNGRSSANTTASRSGAASGYRGSTGGDRYYRDGDYRSTYSNGYNSNGYGSTSSGTNGHSTHSSSNGNGRTYGASSGYEATADSQDTPPSASHNRYYRYSRGTYGGSYYGHSRSEAEAAGSKGYHNGAGQGQTATGQGATSSSHPSSGSRTTANGSASSNGGSSNGGSSNGGAATNGAGQSSGPYQTYRQRRDAAAGVGSAGTSNHTNPGSGHSPSSYDSPTNQAPSRDNGTEQGYNTYNAHTRHASSSAHRARQNRDLSGTDLSGANLREKDFSNRNLSEANLSGADLSDAFLHKVNLNRANLSRAKLFRANLLQADLSHANLREADLIGADFSGADLSGADLSGAKVAVGGRTMVKLTGTILTGAIMPDGSIHD